MVPVHLSFLYLLFPRHVPGQIFQQHPSCRPILVPNKSEPEKEASVQAMPGTINGVRSVVNAGVYPL